MFFLLAYTQYPIMSKWNYVFRNCYKLIKNYNLECLESISTQPFVMASQNKFRSKHLLCKSHNKLHGLTLCAIIDTIIKGPSVEQ